VSLQDSVDARLARGSHPDLQGAPTREDVALFAALTRGDRDALAALYDLHARTLFVLAMHRVGDRARAEDVLHDTFVDLMRLARESDARCPPVLRWLVQRLVARASSLAPRTVE
jgi:RNA polymerase sigma-70 factor, ECF subfamily